METQINRFHVHRNDEEEDYVTHTVIPGTAEAYSGQVGHDEVL